MNKTINIDEIRKWHSLFKRDGELFEIRILCGGGKTYSGYFTNIEDAIPLLPQYDQYQIYFTVNEVKPACSSRKQYNNFMFVSGSATSKNDIQHRWWLPIDIDVERPTDVSSTDEEKQYAHQKAGSVYKFLLSKGFPSPIVCDSSSGYHLYYPIDMPNTDEVEKLIKSFYEVVSNFFTDERVKIDKVVGDANRIMRMAGTWGRKGRDSEERPHRMAKIVLAPQISSRLTQDVLSNFISQYKVVEEERVYRNTNYASFNGEPFDLRKFIEEHGISIAKEMSWNGGTKFILKECPFDSSHKAPDSAIFQNAQGAIGFKCLHNSCANHDWHELREKLDPNAYAHSNQNEYRPRIQYRQYVPVVTQKPAYEIKGELPELGEKWLTMSSIKKLDLTKLEKVKTGYIELDKKIGGLYMSEVTVLSGSNSSGKSSWLNSLLLNIIQQDYKVALWSGELRADILKAWIQMPAAGADNLRPSQYEKDRYFVPDNIGKMIDQWLDGKFFLYNNGYGTKAEQILHDMDILLKANVKVFILDNLMTLDVDLFDGDKNSKQKELILRIKDFAMKNMVHVILVAHPRKVTTFLRKNDISGTSDITNAVDNVLIMHRTNEDFLHAITDFYDAARANQYRQFGNVLAVEKNRLFGVVDFMCGFHYDIISRRFKNTPDEHIKYGWELPPKQITFNYQEDRCANYEGDEPDNQELDPLGLPITGNAPF